MGHGMLFQVRGQQLKLFLKNVAHHGWAAKEILSSRSSSFFGHDTKIDLSVAKIEVSIPLIKDYRNKNI